MRGRCAFPDTVARVGDAGIDCRSVEQGDELRVAVVEDDA